MTPSSTILISFRIMVSFVVLILLEWVVATLEEPLYNPLFLARLDLAMCVPGQRRECERVQSVWTQQLG
jgi:hypothetical protein